jgi:hypothetical protein
LLRFRKPFFFSPNLQNPGQRSQVESGLLGNVCTDAQD